jgi:hypothetical protein
MHTQPNEDFAEWACSLSGCDGGNPHAETWLCGIEWGGTYGSEEADMDYYQQELREEIAAGPYQPAKRYDWAEHCKYRYGISVAKLYAAYRGLDVESYYEHIKSFSDTELFRLNLYPVSFRNTDYGLWHRYELDKVTGFDDKELYRIWCFLYRFPAFAERVKEFRPKLIIGTGVSYVTDFFACFAGNNGIASQIKVGDLRPQSESNKTPRRYYWCQLATGTTLAIIPFFSGSYGLNSNHLLQQMGNILGQITK